MRRRLTAAMVGVVVVALVLSGLFTLVLVARASREDARRRLVEQAEAFAGQMGAVIDQENALALLRRTLRLEGATVVAVTPAGRVVGALPEGLTAQAVEPGRLQAGETV
ncbi:MAG: hypothetical protein ACRD0D_15140, partial [Acidimicrobiales bacterium]